MPKYYGKIGFAESVIDPNNPYVHSETIVERPYSGDITRNTRRLSQLQDKVNDELTISNDISVVLDPYAKENFHKIKYVTYMGSKWKVQNIMVTFPRLILYLGGLYTEEEEVEEQDGDQP